ncbi:zinc-dependent alcohol dehydrogenase [Micromonospora sp. NBC_01796]|uniref:zinc-dependent alcohol dehydrogenase n=1 Tax=Micromonospora sp. NBC_01796 TaxID=2975987 RepID=UPI002DDC021C|nr:zinc-binding alcohol dehydrogenase [Micromonospora sp. NBC_01796]WSA86454.1 zinc-binding alcohol dehydrogenase [Micromonospora sp. NBC_01796]
MSGISHGTEMAWVKGTAAALHRSWNGEHRTYVTGAGRDYPVAPGYETIARVVEVGDEVTGIRVDDLVMLDRPHAEYHLVNAATAPVVPLPAGTDPERAVFGILARVALGGVHDAAIKVGETVVVSGLGTVGLLAAQQARLAGAAHVIGVDRYPLRIAAARSLGVNGLHAASGVDIAAEVRRLVGSTEGADAAIEASGSYAGLHEAIRTLRVGGRVATVASYHGDQPGLRLGEEYHRNRITMISSMTVNGCPQRDHPAWTLDRLSTTARRLLADGQIRVDNLITHRIRFRDAAAAYRLIADNAQTTIKVVLTYDD